MNMFQGPCTQKTALLIDVQMVKINLDLINWLLGTNFLGHFLRPFSSFTMERITIQLSDFPHYIHHI